MSEGRPGRRALELVAVGPVEDGLLAYLGRELDRRFGTRSFRGPPLPLHEAWRDPDRGRHLSSTLVDALLARADALGTDPSGHWMLGVTQADLCAPDRDFVFGEATVGGPSAVISLARLARGAGASRLRARALAEAVHELVHLAGLGHCPHPSCVMHPAEDVEDVDRRGGEPCAVCARRLKALHGVNFACTWGFPVLP